MKHIALLAALSLASCNTASTDATILTVGADLGTARTLAQTAISAWPVVKGFAMAAALADPSLAPQINSAISAIEPNVSKAQMALNLASTTAPVLLAMASDINAAAGKLTVAAAPAVKVVANK